MTIGISEDGQLVRSSAKDGVHYMGGGTTGSGKSVCLQSLVFSLVYAYPPELVRVVLIDPKMVTFSQAWEKLPHLSPIGYTAEGILREKEEILECLRSLYQLAQKRYKLLESNELENIYEYNQKFPNKLPVIYVFFDELSKFKEGKELCSELSEILEKMASYVRAAGIVLVLFTQKPHSSVIPTNVKGNMPSAIGLKTRNYNESMLIINESGCEKLGGKGDTLFTENGSEPIRLQVPDGAKKLLALAIERHHAQPPTPSPTPDKVSHLEDCLRAEYKKPTPSDTSPIDLDKKPLFEGLFKVTPQLAKAILKCQENGLNQSQTIKKLWGINKNGRKGSKYQKARDIYQRIIANKNS